MYMVNPSTYMEVTHLHKSSAIKAIYPIKTANLEQFAHYKTTSSAKIEAKILKKLYRTPLGHVTIVAIIEY